MIQPVIIDANRIFSELIHGLLKKGFDRFYRPP